MYDLEVIREKISLAELAEEAGAQFDNPHRLISRCPLPRHAGDRSSKALTIFKNKQRGDCLAAIGREVENVFFGQGFFRPLRLVAEHSFQCVSQSAGLRFQCLVCQLWNHGNFDKYDDGGNNNQRREARPQ